MRVRNDSQAHSETMVFRHRGRLLARALLALLVVALLAEVARIAVARDLIGGEAPDFVLKSTTGRNIRLSEYRGDVVALTFGASWCGDCRDALRTLSRIRGTESGERVQLLAVTFDHDAGAAQGFVAAADAATPVLVDAEGVVGRLYDVGKLPAVVLIDRDGRIRGVSQGVNGSDEPALARRVREILAE